LLDILVKKESSDASPELTTSQTITNPIASTIIVDNGNINSNEDEAFPSLQSQQYNALSSLLLPWLQLLLPWLL
jgi:hypothetical protein